MKKYLTLLMAGVLLLGLTGFVIAQDGVRATAGDYIGEAGQQIRIQEQANNQLRVEVGGVGVDCDCNLTQELVQDRTKLYVELSNGRNAEVKVMPDAASETALERLRLKNCTPENECSIELKEVGVGNLTRAAYEVQTQRSSRFLGIFRTKMNVQAQVDAETGEVIKVDKPWWAFLASEPAEE